jgi:hypothetical protein
MACWLCSIWLCSIWLLTACSSPHAPLPPLPDLHLPGVVRITSFDDLIASTGVRQRLDQVAVYQYQRGTGVASSGEIRVLTVGPYQQLYEASLTDRTVQPVARMQGACSGEVATSWDSQWAACASEAGVRLFPLPLAAGTSDQLKLILPGGEPGHQFYGPSWGATTAPLRLGKYKRRDRPGSGSTGSPRPTIPSSWRRALPWRGTHLLTCNRCSGRRTDNGWLSPVLCSRCAAS